MKSKPGPQVAHRRGDPAAKLAVSSDWQPVVCIQKISGDAINNDRDCN